MSSASWEVLWRTKIPGALHCLGRGTTGRSNPVASGDQLFVSILHPPEIVALDASTGQIRWRHPLEHHAGAHVTVEGDVVYARTTRALFCLEAATGVERWRFRPYADEGDWFGAYPEIEAGRLFIGDRTGWFHCLEAQTGRPIWRKFISSERGHPVNSTALACGETVYVGTNAGALLAIDPAAGEVRWQAAVEGPLINRPFLALHGIVAQLDDTLALFDLRNGDLQRSWTFRGRSIKSATGNADSLYALVTAPDQCVRIDGEGQLAFDVRSARYPHSIQYVEEFQLLYVTSNGGIVVRDPATAKILGHVEAPQEPHENLIATPEVRPGRLFFVSAQGTVCSIRHPELRGTPPPPSGPDVPGRLRAALALG